MRSSTIALLGSLAVHGLAATLLWGIRPRVASVTVPVRVVSGGVSFFAAPAPGVGPVPGSPSATPAISRREEPPPDRRPAIVRASGRLAVASPSFLVSDSQPSRSGTTRTLPSVPGAGSPAPGGTAGLAPAQGGEETAESGAGSISDLAAITARIQAAAVYPSAARRLGRSGVVRVAMHIGADGAVSALRVVRSAGVLLDQAAETAVRDAAPLPFGPRDAEIDLRFRLDARGGR